MIQVADFEVHRSGYLGPDGRAERPLPRGFEVKQAAELYYIYDHPYL